MGATTDLDDPFQIHLFAERLEQRVQSGRGDLEGLSSAALRLVPEPVRRPKQRAASSASCLSDGKRREEELTAAKLPSRPK